MESDQSIDQLVTKKRKSANTKGDDSPKNKKVKSSLINNFRKRLSSGDKLEALQEFLKVLSNSSETDYAFDYLDRGGNILELLQTLESDSTIPPVIVFNIINQLLLKISANYGQFYNSSYEACRYLINSYLPVIHKMIGLSSSKEERKVCLKLLTAMVTFSGNLAKDILLNVKFHSPNIDLLTKHTGEKDNVRDSFIHFLTSFLIDSDSHILQILLGRSSLFTSIISGLQYDVVDTVCIVISAMKNYILQNNLVMKTTKMHVFNTAIVRDIVSLYNWKGPEGFKANKNDKRIIEVDKVAKSKVNECVHDFLLVLCTNLKYGVIFRDPLVGLGRRNQNGLMYTVLNSLDRPWEHSYASELVINICKSCPDLTKHMWTLLTPFLEPRLAEKWFKAIDFLKKLLETLKPECIDYCARSLNPLQLAQVIEILASPVPVLKALLSGDHSQDDASSLIKHIYSIVLCMLQEIQSYVNAIESWTTPANVKKIKQILSNFIARHYPAAQKLLSDWKIYTSEEKLNAKLDYLEIILSVLKLYQTLAPQMLYELSSNKFEVAELFIECVDDDDRQKRLTTNVTDIFIDIDSSYFLPNTESFFQSISLLLPFYHKNKTEDILKVLRKVLKNCDIFDDFLGEIDIWSNAIFNCKSISSSFIELFMTVLKDASANMLIYQDELSHIESQEYDRTSFNFNEDIEDITYQIKHNHFSILTVSFLKHLQENDMSKTVKKYLEFVLINIFHSQTLPGKFLKVVQTHHSVIPCHVLEYMESWCMGSCKPLEKVKGSLNILKTFSEYFITTTLKGDVFGESLYPGFSLDILRSATFYFTTLIKFNSVKESHLQNWVLCVEQLHKQNSFDNDYLEVVLANPYLVHNFDINQASKESASGLCTRAIFTVVQMTSPVERFILVYSQSIFNCIVKNLKKTKKIYLGDYFGEYLKAFPLNYYYCNKIIELIAGVLENCGNTISNILSYCIGRISNLCKENSQYSPLKNVIITKITHYMAEALNLDDCSGLSSCLLNYLQTFPYSIIYIHENLFPNLLRIKEYNKENADLTVFLLERNLTLSKYISENITTIAEKKGLVLPITHVLVNSNAPEDILKLIFENLEGAFVKALQKPQKVGQHFLKNYDVHKLIESYMALDKCKPFVDKVQRFEVTEVFHAKLLEAVISRIITESELNEKQISNVILTFVHMQMTLFKKKTSEDCNSTKIVEVAIVFNRILEKLASKTLTNLKALSINETFNTFIKFVLKYGISGQHVLLETLVIILGILSSTLDKEQAGVLLEMLLSHSEFLNVTLGEHGDTKLAILKLLLIVSKNWPDLMERSHVPVLLAAYRGLVTRCDRVTLKLLKLYESKAEQTHFYDFKPFLWGRAAATHYSVRTNIETSLTRQPKMTNILGGLKQDLVNSTIINYPLRDSLTEDEIETVDRACYDLKFLLPLFSHLLAPEQQVKTYVFTRSGALSLTVIGLSSTDKEVRQAACHILSRFQFHLEARQTGKDNLLWIRFVEALCKGVAVLRNFKLNNFAAIFFARMSLILTNPKHSMYTPLCSYLSAKQNLDLSTVPELYTLLFSSDVNFREHRNFILEILRDGLRTERDFLDFLKSMGFKLFSELFSSCLADSHSRLLILDVLHSACKIPLGVKMLCENYSLLTQLYNVVHQVLSEQKGTGIISRIIGIFLEIVKVRQDAYTSKFVFNLFIGIIKSDVFDSFNEDNTKLFYDVIYRVFLNCSEVVSCKDSVLKILLDKSDDKFVKYLRTYGCSFVSDKLPEFYKQDKYIYLRFFVFSLLK